MGTGIGGGATTTSSPSAAPRYHAISNVQLTLIAFGRGRMAAPAANPAIRWSWNLSRYRLFEYLKDHVPGFLEGHGCLTAHSVHGLHPHQRACQNTGARARIAASPAVARHWGWAKFRVPANRSLMRCFWSDSALHSRPGGLGIALSVGPPDLKDFLRPGHQPASAGSNIDCTLSQVPYLCEEPESSDKHLRRIYVETYGCQMNVNDIEVVLAIMRGAGYSQVVERPEEADVILINTCAIRDNAEHKIWHRLNYFKHIKSTWSQRAVSVQKGPSSPPRVAVLGCMAERLKQKLIEADKTVDVVCGPDAYRDLPRLLMQVEEGQTAINTLLSLEETYADVSPVRISKSSISAFVSIMRGCNNMCSFCIVPFTRGRERSRPLDSVVREVGELWEQGVKEVTLLGQNVNSYNDCSGNMIQGWYPKVQVGAGNKDDGDNAGVPKLWSEDPSVLPSTSPVTSSTVGFSAGFSSICKVKEVGLRFVHLMDCLSSRYPGMRFRFTSPHPKDFPDELLFLMRDRPNICKSIHLPAQSGSTGVLQRMRRGYTREAYLSLVDRIRSILPSVSISSDFITGFCGETEGEHKDTLSLVEAVGYDMAYMFAFSMREKTHASRHYVDDVESGVKQRRLAELIETFRTTTGQRYTSLVGSRQIVLVDGPNKRNRSGEVIGRNDMGHRVLFPNFPVSMTAEVLDSRKLQEDGKIQAGAALPKAGDYVEVQILEASTASLRGEAVAFKNGL